MLSAKIKDEIRDKRKIKDEFMHVCQLSGDKAEIWFVFIVNNLMISI